MLVIPLAWNEVGNATIAEAAQAFWPGFPIANLSNADDILRPTLCRGRVTVTAGVNDKIDGDDGAPFTATLAAGESYSVTEYCQRITTALNAASTNWRCRWLQGSTNRYRIEVYRTSGTGSLLNETGANAATNALVLDGGFRAQDRAAAASHVGDLPVTCGGGTRGDRITATWATPRTIQAYVLLGPQVGAGAVYVDGTSGADAVLGDAPDDEVLAAFGIANSAGVSAATLHFGSARRSDGAMNGAAYWYAGPVWDTDDTASHTRVNWDVSTYRRTPALRQSRSTIITGQPWFSELAHGEQFQIGFQSLALAPGDAAQAEAVLAVAGRGSLLIVALDPTNEPNRETRLCRVATDPQFSRNAVQGRLGRWSLNLDLEVVRLT